VETPGKIFSVKKAPGPPIGSLSEPSTGPGNLNLKFFVNYPGGMNMTNLENTAKQKKNNATDKNVEVLYQKMGNRWFAFSVVSGEVFMGSITQEEIDVLDARENARTFKVSGNS
jgi:hypothetical protein